MVRVTKMVKLFLVLGVFGIGLAQAETNNCGVLAGKCCRWAVMDGSCAATWASLDGHCHCDGPADLGKGGSHTVKSGAQ